LFLLAGDRDGGASPGGGDAHGRAAARCRNSDCPLWPSRSVRGSGHVEKRMASYCALAVRATCPRGQIAGTDETISVGRIPAL
jgi:hypothetical protein